MSGANGASDAREQVLAELRDGEKFCLLSHEHPDGDALGSLVAMRGILRALGKDVLVFVAPTEFPLPDEYGFFDFGDAISAAPADVMERTIVFLDCGNLDRNPAGGAVPPGSRIVNIDHHHDNTRFGIVNHVVSDASSTAEIVWDLMHGLGVAPTLEVAEALYVGLITDTGRFMYENTGPRAHVMAAELIEAGVDVHAVYHRIYEGMPFGKLALLARGLANVERHDDGLLTITRLSRADFEESGAEESYSEGVVDHLRSVRGTAVAGLVRELLGDGKDGTRKVSLCATDDRVDVSRIAREQGGGGHRQAAGFTTDLAWDELVDFIRGAIAAQLGELAASR